jgi:hypothetical protein
MYMPRNTEQFKQQTSTIKPMYQVVCVMRMECHMQQVHQHQLERLVTHSLLGQGLRI